MKWLLIVTGSVLALILMIVLVGFALPEKHVATRSVELRQRSETVWDVIAGPPTWRSEIEKYEILPASDGRRRWRETDRHGQTITYETVEEKPPRRLVTRIADDNLPFGGMWTLDLTPSPNGTRLTITENGKVSNPIYRFVSKFIFGHYATIDAYLANLQRKLERQ